MSLAGSGVLLMRVVVKLKEQRVPIETINPGVKPIKLYKEMKIGSLQQVNVEIEDPVH